MTVTRQHFELVARVLREARSESDRTVNQTLDALVSDFVDAFRGNNSGFKPSLFAKRAGYGVIGRG